MKHNNAIPTPSVPCAQWARKLAAAHPGDISSTERAALDNHIQSCPACASVQAEYREMDARILALPPVTPLTGLPASLQHIFSEQPGDEQQHTGKGSAAPIAFPTTMQSTPSMPVSVTSPKRLMRLASAIAAVLVVGALIVGFLILFTGHHTTLVGGNAPSNANSVIFVASEDDGTVYAVRPSDGALYWQHTIGHKLTGAPVASQDAVFAGSYDGHIYALRRSDGSLTWSSPAIPGSAVQSNFADSKAVYVSATSAIYALSAHDGKILWSRSIHGCNTTCGASFVAVTDGTAYAYLDGLYALRTSDGKVLWHHPEFQFTTRSFVATDGKVYIPVDRDGNVYVLRASDGQSLHTLTYQKDEPIELVATNGIIYIDSAGHDVYALRTSDDSTLWHKQFDAILLGMSSSNDGTLYFSETLVLAVAIQVPGQTPTPNTSPPSIDVYALRTSDGTQRWHWHPSTATGGSTDVLAINGTAYLTVGNSLYALQASDGTQRWVLSESTTLTSPVAG